MKDGCEISPSCENCPIDRCIYGREKGYEKSQRNEEINRLYHSGIPIQELAKRFQVSTRTINRIIKQRDLKVLTTML